MTKERGCDKMKMYRYAKKAKRMILIIVFNTFVWYQSKYFYEIGIRRGRKWLIVAEQ